MKQALLILLAVTALTAAMVPRQRRAIDLDGKESRTICAKQTPCAWSIYDPKEKRIDDTVTNTYCDCGEGTTCAISEDNHSANALVYRCRPQAEAES